MKFRGKRQVGFLPDTLNIFIPIDSTENQGAGKLTTEGEYLGRETGIKRDEKEKKKKRERQVPVRETPISKSIKRE